MTSPLLAPLSGCPACAAVPAVQAIAGQSATSRPDATVQITLSVPSVHCGGCIATLERGLVAHPDVVSARVNLTLKRVMIAATPEAKVADLIRASAQLGFEAHELDQSALSNAETDRAGRDLLMRLAVAGFASMNIMLLSVAVWAGAQDATRDMFHWISAAIALPTIAFSAQPFFRHAWGALSAGRLNMDVPISLAILLAVVTSLWETSLSGAHAYFDAAVMLTFFLLAGRYLDHRTRAVARSAAQELSALEVPRAWRITDTGEVDVPAAQLTIGDLIRVRPGGRMPVDGVVTAGTSELDRSLLTGETLPVLIAPGQPVSAGEVNLSGPLTIRAVAVGADTSLHHLADLVAIAESGRSRYTSLADMAARLYAPGVHILSALAFAGWYLATGDLRTALNIAAAVLIITCPCALGLAVPAVTTAASGRLFRKGMLIKHETALERLAQVDTVVFDKTGTLTKGAPKLVDPAMLDHPDAGLILALAQVSDHPLARTIATAGTEAGIVALSVEDIEEVPGYGITGRYRGQKLRLGRAEWVGADAAPRMASYFKHGDRDPVVFEFEDDLRDGALDCVQALRDAGMHIHLISGDTRPVVQEFAERLGITDWVAGATPVEKTHRIKELSDAGAHVLMVGDGLNDTAALASAHVSMSPASALDAARVASDIVLLGSSLNPIPGACATATRARARIRENFRIATIYNIVAVPLAMAGLATPLIAALAMSASSITVSLNALRVR